MKLSASTCGAALCAIVIGSLAGCGSDNSDFTPPAPSTVVHFSFFTEDVFGASANSKPVAVNGVMFDYDVNDDPSAFNYAFVM